ncbi:MAG: hypothetical protein LUC98_10895 [Lachnospiraceae bacterium]|nr:hypothetical protein [Lachnospiraceae bacterium]
MKKKHKRLPSHVIFFILFMIFLLIFLPLFFIILMLYVLFLVLWDTPWRGRTDRATGRQKEEIIGEYSVVCEANENDIKNNESQSQDPPEEKYCEAWKNLLLEQPNPRDRDRQVWLPVLTRDASPWLVAERYDSSENKTGAGWVVLAEGADLAEAIDAYIEHDVPSDFDSNWVYRPFREGEYLHIRVRSSQAITDLEERREDIFEKCRENKIRIIMGAEPYEYYDFVSGDTCKVKVGSRWPGSADDAATYCNVIMERIPRAADREATPGGVVKEPGNMHKGKWFELREEELSNDRRIWVYKSESNYSAAMLVEDLLEAGFTIGGIDYEEDADVGMKYFVGSYVSAEQFLRDYSWLCSQGMGGMRYRIFCTYNGISCEFNMEDSESGHSSNRISLSGRDTEQLALLAGQLKSLLQKEGDKNARPSLKVYREWYDTSEKKRHRVYQLEPKRLYFLTVYTSEDEEFMGYSFDVEAAADSHYLFGEKGEKRLREILGCDEENGTLAEVLVDYFSRGGDGHAMESAVYRVCDRWYHYD